MTLERDSLLHRRYRIVEILGQGGMGSVYRAVDENLGMDVAVKENLFTTDEYARQFRLEAVILANLRHTNLPRVSDHFVVGDQGQYLVMDFIEGEDLRQRMERMGTITEDDAVQIGAAICDALEYLHTRKPSILHRDIKPGNVKITPDGHIFLVDFGLAKVVQGTQATTTGARAMTPGYSPPEQYGTARTDPRTDVYSLGATLYASLCGVIPEDGLARAMDNAQLTPLRKRNPKVSRKLAAAIEKAMAVDPSDRFQTADEFKKALLASRAKPQPASADGGFTVSPPPPESLVQKDLADMVLDPVVRPKTPIPPTPFLAPEEEQPFISPLKRQKERERKRQNARIRFLLVLLLLTGIGIPILGPAILPNWRSMIPVLVPRANSTPTNTLSSLPTATITAAVPVTSTVETPVPTSTPTKKAPAVIVTETLIVTMTETPTTTLTPETSLPVGPTPIGGGSGEVAFASSQTGIPQIYLIDVSEGDPIQLTNMPDGACQPSWSPDGARLVFVSPCKGMEDIYFNAIMYIINADGSGLTPIITVPGGDFEPNWSPDGSKIAFTSLRAGKLEIYVYNLNDQSVTQLTNRSLDEASRQPAWSPDGTQIAYVVQRLGVRQIWLMSATGEDQRQIVRSGTRLTDYHPIWTLDGKLIIFNQRRADTFSLPYLMSIDPVDLGDAQGNRVPLNVLPVEDAEFSPDGFWIVYEGNNRDILYIMLTGGGRTPINTGDSPAFDPVWRPLK